MRVAFLTQDLQLSGGVGVLVRHAAGLRAVHGVETAVVLTREPDAPNWAYPGLASVPVLDLETARTQEWDIVVATWWQTTEALFALPTKRHAFFVQLLEDTTYELGAPERIAAAAATGLPVRLLTEARWIAELLEDLQPGADVLYVRNGLAKEDFHREAPPSPALEHEPLKILIEGARGYRHKGVDDALAAVAAMREPAEVTWVSPHRVGDPPRGVHQVLAGLPATELARVMGEHHVLLKLSRAEGMYGPPLEAFHMGATVVTTPVTGHDEYVRHRENGWVTGWDDTPGTARALDLLARDRRLLHELRTGAWRTAKAWPDWPQSTATMALALRRVLSDPPPPADPAGHRLVSDLATALAEQQRTDHDFRIAQQALADIRSQKAWKAAIAARRQLDTVRSAVRTVRHLGDR